MRYGVRLSSSTASGMQCAGRRLGVLGVLSVLSVLGDLSVLRASGLRGLEPTELAHAEPSGAKLSLGDLAPPLQVSAWLQGEATPWQADKIGVLDFFATTSALSRQGCAALNELHDRFSARGVCVVGVSDQDVDAIRTFLARTGAEVPRYRVALDDRKATYQAYRLAQGRSMDETTFVIDGTGRLAWTGRPRDAAGIVERLLAGTYDVAAEARLRTHQLRCTRLLSEYLGKIQEGTDAAQLKPLTDELLELGKEFPESYFALARAIMVVPGLRFQDLDLVVRASERAEAVGHRVPEVQYFRGCALARKGDLEAALGALEKARDASEGEIRRNIEAELDRVRVRQREAAASRPRQD